MNKLSIPVNVAGGSGWRGQMYQVSIWVFFLNVLRDRNVLCSLVGLNVQPSRE